jgi:hypothetical protein
MAVEAETRLASHRSPTPLFQPDFDALQRCIYHLGSPYLKDPLAAGAYTAGDLLTEWADVIHFKPEFVPHVRRLLEELLAASPVGRLVFTSDYQFGPVVRRYRRPLSLTTFWKRHDARRLHTNALYSITRLARDRRLKAVR